MHAPLSAQVRLLTGDARRILPTIRDASVNCVVTSPPYWGLRDYGVAGQIGLEASFETYVAEMVAVFREVRRVLRPDGTLWLNLGDCYATGAGKVGAHPGGGAQGAAWAGYRGNREGAAGKHDYAGLGPMTQPNRMPQPGLKPKDLVGIPWRVAFALQADGWVLRQEIIWSKPNPMPESVRDRCTKAHEQIFLFAKAKWSGDPPGRYAHISEQDARWLALFFDTEGNLCLRRERAKGADYGAHSAQIVLANSHKGLLERAASIVGDGSILERRGVNAPMFYWQLAGKKAADLLLKIYPYLIVKQRQARCLLYLESTKSYRGGHERLRPEVIAERDRLWSAVKALNHFGSPDISWVPEPRTGGWRDCERYYFDQEAIKEPASYDPSNTKFPDGWDTGAGAHGSFHRGGREKGRKVAPNGRAAGNKSHKYTAAYEASDTEEHRTKAGLMKVAALAGMTAFRNKRSVWTITPKPFREAHFATFPPALVEPCIKAGCPPGGIVLDPFVGSGTTAVVARALGRHCVGIELNPAYVEMAHRRLEHPA